MTPDAWRRAGRTFDYRGHRVFFRDDGRDDGRDGDRSAGVAVLCIHGFPTASWDWHAIWDGLTRDRRVIAPDMLGFGFSAKPAGWAYSIHDQASLHEDLLVERGVARVHVVAHDYGVSVAQELLARHLDRAASGERGPELVSVTLLNGGLFPETHRARPVQRLLHSPLGPLAARLLGERAFRHGFAQVFGPRTRPTDDELRDFWALVAHDGGQRRLPELMHYLDDRRRHRARWVGALQRTRVPLRLINGPEDPVSGAHLVARYRELVAAPDVVSLPGVGHYPQVEAPAAVLDAILAHVARAAAQQPS